MFLMLIILILLTTDNVYDMNSDKIKINHHN